MSRANPRFKRTNAPLPAFVFPIYQVTVSGIIDQQTWLCTMCYLARVAAQTPASEANLAASWLTVNNAAWRACMDGQTSLLTVKVTCVSAPARIPGFAFQFGAGSLGTAPAGHLDSEVAAILSKATLTKGQHGRGRLYIPGVPTSFISTLTDPNRINGASLATYGTLATSLMAPILDGANSADPGLYTRLPKGQPVTAAQILSAINTRALLGTVRRRRIGRGK
jgi:hypothetical protein